MVVVSFDAIMVNVVQIDVDVSSRGGGVIIVVAVLHFLHASVGDVVVSSSLMVVDVLHFLPQHSFAVVSLAGISVVVVVVVVQDVVVVVISVLDLCASE